MNLDRELRRQLVDAVFRFLDASPNNLAKLLLGTQAMMRAPAGANQQNFSDWVVGYILNQQTPDLFIRVVRRVDDAGTLVEIHRLVDGLEADPSGWMGRLAGGLWVPESWPFLDRGPLRTTMAAMAQGHPPAAIVIEGPFGFGKRTIGEYVRKLARDTGAFAPVVVELRQEPESGLLIKMVEDIAMAFGADVDTSTTHVEPERVAELLARDIAEAALASRGTVWFVATVIDQSGLEPGVLRFVDELLRLLETTPSLADRLRVLVCCDQVSSLGLEHPPPVAQRYPLTQVTDKEIREWLEEAAPGKPADLYAFTAARVMAKLEEHGQDEARRLRTVSKQCASAHIKLLNAT